MYNNSEFCYYSSIVIKNRLPIDYSLDKEQTSYDDLLDALRLSLKGYNIKSTLKFTNYKYYIS
jgi:hypothetical protein